MAGGDYYTWFDSKDSESRKKLYFLENYGLVRHEIQDLVTLKFPIKKLNLSKEEEESIENDKRLGKLWKKINRFLERGEVISHKGRWVLTSKGKELVKQNKDLQELWQQGRILEFYEEVKNSLKK